MKSLIINCKFIRLYKIYNHKLSCNVSFKNHSCLFSYCVQSCVDTNDVS